MDQANLPPLVHKEIPDLTLKAVTPRAPLGDSHSPSRTVGLGMSWEGDEEESLSYSDLRMFPVSGLKAKRSSLSQLFGLFHLAGDLIIR